MLVLPYELLVFLLGICHKWCEFCDTETAICVQVTVQSQITQASIMRLHMCCIPLNGLRSQLTILISTVCPLLQYELVYTLNSTDFSPPGFCTSTCVKSGYAIAISLFQIMLPPLR